MLFIYFINIIYQAYSVVAYKNTLFNLVDHSWNNTGGCGGITDMSQPLVEVIHKLGYTTRRITFVDGFTFSTVPPPRNVESDPFAGFQNTLNKVLFGEAPDTDEKLIKIPEVATDLLGIHPSGQILRAERFQNKSMVHLPRSEWLHTGHLYLNTASSDFMQTAVNAYSILLEGTLADVLNLPPMYVLRSCRTIAMMKIAREKLMATWRVVKGDHEPVDITYRTLEYYRPLFKYVNGREMARLNLSDNRILSYLGTHPELDRHQVGIITSRYIKENENWDAPRYLNLMNNLICGVPMKFMRRIPENVYLQLSHQLFYHIKACDPLQRRFFLAMMTRTQVLGKSNSWGARDVARLGLLLTEVGGPDLSTISPEAMSGVTPQVMMEMSAHNLKFLTETQLRYLSQKSLNILTKKLHLYDDQTRMLNFSAQMTSFPNFILCFVIAMKLVA